MGCIDLSKINCCEDIQDGVIAQAESIILSTGDLSPIAVGQEIEQLITDITEYQKAHFQSIFDSMKERFNYTAEDNNKACNDNASCTCSQISVAIGQMFPGQTNRLKNALNACCNVSKGYFCQGSDRINLGGGAGDCQALVAAETLIGDNWLGEVLAGGCDPQSQMQPGSEPDSISIEMKEYGKRIASADGVDFNLICNERPGGVIDIGNNITSKKVKQIKITEIKDATTIYNYWADFFEGWEQFQNTPDQGGYDGNLQTELCKATAAERLCTNNHTPKGGANMANCKNTIYNQLGGTNQDKFPSYWFGNKPAKKVPSNPLLGDDEKGHNLTTWDGNIIRGKYYGPPGPGRAAWAKKNVVDPGVFCEFMGQEFACRSASTGNSSYGPTRNCRNGFPAQESNDKPVATGGTVRIPPTYVDGDNPPTAKCLNGEPMKNKVFVAIPNIPKYRKAGGYNFVQAFRDAMDNRSFDPRNGQNKKGCQNANMWVNSAQSKLLGTCSATEIRDDKCKFMDGGVVKFGDKIPTNKGDQYPGTIWAPNPNVPQNISQEILDAKQELLDTVNEMQLVFGNGLIPGYSVETVTEQFVQGGKTEDIPIGFELVGTDGFNQTRQPFGEQVDLFLQNANTALNNIRTNPNIDLALAQEYPDPSDWPDSMITAVNNACRDLGFNFPHFFNGGGLMGGVGSVLDLATVAGANFLRNTISAVDSIKPLQNRFADAVKEWRQLKNLGGDTAFYEVEYWYCAANSTPNGEGFGRPGAGEVVPTKWTYPAKMDKIYWQMLRESANILKTQNDILLQNQDMPVGTKTCLSKLVQHNPFYQIIRQCFDVTDPFEANNDKRPYENKPPVFQQGQFVDCGDQNAIPNSPNQHVCNQNIGDPKNSRFQCMKGLLTVSKQLATSSKGIKGLFRDAATENPFKNIKTDKIADRLKDYVNMREAFVANVQGGCLDTDEMKKLVEFKSKIMEGIQQLRDTLNQAKEKLNN